MEDSSKHARESLIFSLWFVILMWFVHFYKVYSGFSLSSFGVFPRELSGMIGIFTAPLVHGDWEHLISNSLPMLMLTFTISFFYRRVANSSFILIYLLTGFMVWFLARPVYHIGASGVVYGLVSFVFWTGIFRRNLKSIVLALSVLVLYSGYFMGIVPFKEGVSWESHLFGGIVGIVIAYLLKGVIEKDEEEKPSPWESEKYETKKYLLAPDSFEMTRDERQALFDQLNEMERGNEL